VLRILARFRETGSVHDRKISCRPTVLSDVSVGKHPTFLG